MKWISLLPDHLALLVETLCVETRWLSVICGLNSYLSSRCLIGRDYTLPQKRVKRSNSTIIGYQSAMEKHACYLKCAIIKNWSQAICVCLTSERKTVLRVS